MVENLNFAFYPAHVYVACSCAVGRITILSDQRLSLNTSDFNNMNAVVKQDDEDV